MSPQTVNTVSVLTLNIWNRSGDWRARREAILSVLRSTDPDLVCLQEVVGDDERNQAGWLAERCDRHAVFAGAGGPEGGDRFGNAVLSRWPIVDHAAHELPHVPDPAEIQRLVLHARTDGIDVFCTHLAWQLHDAALRERQVRSLMAFVRERADGEAPCGPIVAGDLNAEPDSTAVRYLTGLTALDGDSVYLQDAWRLAGDGGPGITWSDANPHAALDQEPERRLDYVLSAFHGPSGTGRPLACQVVADEPVDGVWPSDHHGVLALLQR